MAREFVAANLDRLELDSAPVTAYPFTFACWVRPDRNTAQETLIYIGDKDVDNFHSWQLRINGDVAGDPFRFRTVAGGGSNSASTTTGFSIDTWHHACGVATSGTLRAVFIDGGSKGTITTSATPAGSDRISVGREGDSIPANYFDGRIAEVTIWNVALSDAEVAALASRVSQIRVRPQSIVFYAPLFGVGSPEPDYTSGVRHLTVTGAVLANHAPVAMPWFRDNGWQGAFTAAGAPAGQPYMPRGQGQPTAAGYRDRPARWN